MEMPFPLPRKIGLLADSHSDLGSLETAVDLLKARGAQGFVHLGDICDSLRLDLLEPFMALLQRHGVHAVKGNNDFSLETLLQGSPPELRADTDPRLAFLKGLPMKIVWGHLCFAHSLPFDFLRAFYEPIDLGTVHRAREVFQATEHRILFCGHSHRSVLFRASADRVFREHLPSRGPVFLDPNQRYIHVTGAVCEGECALFDTVSWALERIRIPGAQDVAQEHSVLTGD